MNSEDKKNLGDLRKHLDYYQGLKVKKKEGWVYFYVQYHICFVKAGINLIKSYDVLCKEEEKENALTKKA